MMAASRPTLHDQTLEPARWLAQLFSILLPLAIAALGVLLLVWHRRTWQTVRSTVTEAGELRFHRRRYLRRLQTSGLLVVLGMALEGGQWIAADRHPSLFVFFWCAVSLLAAWMIVLALCDAIATRLHLNDQLRRQVIERAKLNAELTRIKAERQPSTPEPPNPP
jgi:hypothetical protein